MKPQHAVQIELTVPFHDCDPLAIVWHGRYFKYFELCRTALFKTFGLDAPHMLDLGLRMLVTDARCRYSYPLRFGDEFVVGCWLSQRSPLLRVSYDLTNVTRGRRAARAFTQLALTGPAGELLEEMPASFVERLPAEA